MTERTKNRFIRTPRYELWRRLRLCAWLVLPVTAFRAWSVRGSDLLAAISAAHGSLPAVAAALAIFMLQMLMIGALPLIIWWSACTIMMSRARREASFSPTRDLEYYRETLDGASAVQVSMLADLRLEPREDAAATLLSLALKGIISLDGATVGIVDRDALFRLPRNERLLVQFAESGQLDAAGIKEWANIAEAEAIDGILLERASGKRVGILPYALRGCGAGCLVIIAATLLFSAVSALGVGSLLDVMDAVEDDYELVPYMVENPLLLVELIAFVALALFLLVGILFPLIDTIRGIAENGDASLRLRRTKLGEQAAECVFGIRNYLRDFTALSDADRAALMLWDEFAVYAVALGGNHAAVNEILASKGVNRSALGL